MSGDTAPDVCGLCQAPISMKPDAISRRKYTRPENYRCPKCARKKARAMMGDTGAPRKVRS